MMKYNTLLTVDGYEPSHYNQYPENTAELSSYLTFRKPIPALLATESTTKLQTLPDDNRIVWFGLRYLIENFIAVPITHEMIDEALMFYSNYNAGGNKYPFPDHLFRKIVDEYKGLVPLKIEAMPEGSVVYPNTPLVQVSCDLSEFAPLVSWYEAVIVQTWYDSTVATISRRVRDHVNAAFTRSVDEGSYWKKASRLHDFGFRGVSSVESAIKGGMAHLLNFEGTDTVIAAHYAMKYWNNGKQVCSSIPAMAHCTVTPWDTERNAFANMIDNYGHGVFAMVMDSYDFMNAINEIIPSLKQQITEKGGFFVYRPDSGRPIEVVLAALYAADKTFGSDVNLKGYKVIRGAGVIQGDGMSPATIHELLQAVMNAGFSAENVAFGMGGALLQRDLHRDVLSAAFKTSYIKYTNGSERLVMKRPRGDKGKTSLPGKLAVKNGMVYPKELVLPQDDSLRVVFDGRKGGIQPCLLESFDVVRGRVDQQWDILKDHKIKNVISFELKKLQEDVMFDLN